MSNQETIVLRGKLAEYLASMSKKIKTKLELGSNGICLLKHNVHNTTMLEVAIELPENSDVLYFYAPICRVPYDLTEQFFEKILENNLHCVANRQASFGLDTKTQNIVLTYSIAMRHVDEISFSNILNNFIKVAERARNNTTRWMEEIVKQHTLSDEEIEELDGNNHNNIKLRV